MGKYYNRPMLADELIDLHERPRPAPPFTDRHPGLTAAQGYAAAAALHRRRVGAGWAAVGRKIGFTNRTIWPRYGVYEPIWGTVYDRTLVPCRGNAATVRLEGLMQPRIEPEICFGLKSTPRADNPLASIAWVAHAIEIVQCPHPGWKLKLADSTAGNGLHGGWSSVIAFQWKGWPASPRRSPASRSSWRRRGRPWTGDSARTSSTARCSRWPTW
jgi:2-keto-4-pentenoate hydratase